MKIKLELHKTWEFDLTQDDDRMEAIRAKLGEDRLDDDLEVDEDAVDQACKDQRLVQAAAETLLEDDLETLVDLSDINETDFTVTTEA